MVLLFKSLQDPRTYAQVLVSMHTVQGEEERELGVHYT